MGEGKKWANHWRDICAPKLRARKAELGGRALPERVIAQAVAQATNKPSQRSLVAMWLHGEREPFISQFMALCAVLNIEPAEVLGLHTMQTTNNVIIHKTTQIPPRFKKRISARKDKKLAA